MRRLFAYIGFAVVFYIAALVVTFPASRGYALIKEELVGVKLYGLEGSVWSGRAASAEIAGQSFRELQWSMQPLGLLLAKIEFEIAFDGGGRSGHGTVGLGADGSIHLQGVKARLPAAEMGEVFGLWPIKIDGMFDLQLAQLKFNGQSLSKAVGRVQWQAATVVAPMALEFGDLIVELVEIETGIKGVISDGGGALQIDGVVTLQEDGSYQANAAMAARDGVRSQLGQGLRTLGKTAADGRVQVDYSGKL